MDDDKQYFSINWDNPELIKMCQEFKYAEIIMDYYLKPENSGKYIKHHCYMLDRENYDNLDDIYPIVHYLTIDYDNITLTYTAFNLQEHYCEDINDLDYSKFQFEDDKLIVLGKKFHYPCTLKNIQIKIKRPQNG